MGKKDLIAGGIILSATMLFGFIGKGIPFLGIDAKDIMAGFFIWSGYMYSKFGLKIEKRWWTIIVAALIVAVGTEYWQCSMLQFKDNFGLMMPYIATALIGTLMVFGISGKLALHGNWLNRFLVFVGSNTLDILTWHFLSFKLVSLLLIWIYGLPIARLAEFPVIEEFAYQGWWVLYMVVGVAVPLLFVIVCLKIIDNK